MDRQRLKEFESTITDIARCRYAIECQQLLIRHLHAEGRDLADANALLVSLQQSLLSKMQERDCIAKQLESC
jgi:hypothetical protein